VHTDEDIPDERPETQGMDDVPASAGATATELQQHRALSEEARRVYNDLQIEDPTSHGQGGQMALNELSCGLVLLQCFFQIFR